MSPASTDKTNWISNPERKVVAIYASTFIILLISEIAMSLLPGLVFPFGSYVILFIMSTIPLPLFLFIQITFWNATSPFAFLSLIGFIVVILLYPAMCYFLWQQYRNAWILAFVFSVAHIVFDIYLVNIGLASIGAFETIEVFGIAVNLLILYLLWSARDLFFK